MNIEWYAEISGPGDKRTFALTACYYFVADAEGVGIWSLGKHCIVIYRDLQLSAI